MSVIIIFRKFRVIFQKLICCGSCSVACIFHYMCLLEISQAPIGAIAPSWSICAPGVSITYSSLEGLLRSGSWKSQRHVECWKLANTNRQAWLSIRAELNNHQLAYHHLPAVARERTRRCMSGIFGQRGGRNRQKQNEHSSEKAYGSTYPVLKTNI